jgi:hypothetical protein
MRAGNCCPDNRAAGNANKLSMLRRVKRRLSHVGKGGEATADQPVSPGTIDGVVHSADLNRDGKPDLMAINQDSSDLNILLHTMSQQALVFQMINPGAG